MAERQHRNIDDVSGDLRTKPNDGLPQVDTHGSGVVAPVAGVELVSEVAGAASTSAMGAAAKASTRSQPTVLPKSIGRFVVQRQLGQGGFGQVLLAYDPELDRQVALKVPRPDRFASSRDLEEFIREAKTAARLKHPSIVTMHDILRHAESLVIVQEYVEGNDLRQWLNAQASFLPIHAAIALMLGIADAIAFAHESGFIHRDLKPENILLDCKKRPLVADFGLAIHETHQRRKRGEISGSPTYMSPEQVRGETHRLDGRSDLWSLGVIFYELLTGRPPFLGKDRLEIFDEVLHREPTPLRQRRPEIPHEIDRICQRCLAKRVVDRYPSVHDLMDDLRAWQQQSENMHAVANMTGSLPSHRTSSNLPTERPTLSPIVVPKGMRSFGAEDADFFLNLLPGPYDRDGIPSSIRFWKSRIEEMDSNKTFPLGLLYGPSGCGKTSLMKAGLIPRLSDHVQVIYLEASALDIDGHIRRSLINLCPQLAPQTSLPELVCCLRENERLLPGKKVLLVLDQFEQWLYRHPVVMESPLTAALRQCDGGRLQAIVLVRDDFWSAVSRLMHYLEARIVEGENSTLVDLWGLSHAEKVLALFGQAYGQLSENSANWSSGQHEFLQQSVRGISVDERVVPVRLAMFAEMMKNREWTPSILQKVGGIEGIGVTFLQETFESKSAPLEIRKHREAAPRVLQALLPVGKVDIRNATCSREELRAASGIDISPQAFDELIDLLDGKLYLITPVDNDDEERQLSQNPDQDSFSASDATSHSVATPRSDRHAVHYQLTHDYLVPSLREWLTRKQRETRRGQAELRLIERSSIWKERPENKQLPTLSEWWSICWHTKRSQWNESQSIMMRQATRFHLQRASIILSLLLLVGSTLVLMQKRAASLERDARIAGLVDRLISAEPGQLPQVLLDLDKYQEAAAKSLNDILQSPANSVQQSRAQLHARIARVASDPNLAEPLSRQMLNAKIDYLPVITHRLQPYARQFKTTLRELMQDDQADPEHRMRAGLALANYVPPSEPDFWTSQDWSMLARCLVKANPEIQPLLRRCLKPLQTQLLNELEQIANSTEATDAQLLGVANALADYAKDDTRRLATQLAQANPAQFSILFASILDANRTEASELLAEVTSRLPPDDLGSVARQAYGKHRANAAIGLMRLGEIDRAMRVFEYTDDPEALSQWIFGLRDRRVELETVLNCLKRQNPDDQSGLAFHAIYAMLLALAEYSWEEVPEHERQELLSQLTEWFAEHPSAGVHAAAGWLLRHWGHTEIAASIDQTPRDYSPDCEWFTLAIDVVPREPLNAPNSGVDQPSAAPSSDAGGPDPEAGAQPDRKRFYLTFVVVPAGDYWIGSVADEPGRSEVSGRELRHRVALERPIAVLDREISFDELIAFWPGFTPLMQQYHQQPECSAFGCTWYECIAFCRWLSTQHGLSENEQAYIDPAGLDPAEYPKEAAPQASWAPRNWPLDASRPGFRLLTEAEWEIAVRMGTRTAFGFGSDISLLDRFGWYNENSERRVRPGKMLRPGMNGLHDMQGNLAEWVHDWYMDYDQLESSEAPDLSDRALRSVRGGSWNYTHLPCRSAGRAGYQPADRDDFLGFRIALTLPIAQ